MKRLIQVLVLFPLLLLGQENSIINLDESQPQYIVGGEEGSITDYPWQVALVDSNGLGFCGGVIISDSWIVTAAHCLDPSSSEYVSALYAIRAGSSSAYASGGNQFLINQTLTHPNYNTAFNINYDGDIALVEISGVFNFNESIQPIGLVDSNHVQLGLIDQGIPTILICTNSVTLDDNYVNVVCPEYCGTEESFEDLNGNGIWDNGPEPYEDLNNNGSYDFFEIFIDENNNGVHDTYYGQQDTSECP